MIETTSTRYSPQERFRIVGADYSDGHLIDDRHFIRSLQDVERVARGLVFSASASRPSNEAVYHRLRSFERNKVYEIVLDHDTRAYGFVTPAEPDIVHLRYDLCSQLAKLRRAKHDFKELYRQGVVFVAAVLAHELIHVARMMDAGITKPTSPSVHAGSLPVCPVLYGEGGWAFERSLFGGRMRENLQVPTDLPHSQRDLIGTVKSLAIETSMGHILLPKRVIKNLYKQKNENWQESLPLRPTSESDYSHGASLRYIDLAPNEVDDFGMETPPVVPCQQGEPSLRYSDLLPNQVEEMGAGEIEVPLVYHQPYEPRGGPCVH